MPLVIPAILPASFDMLQEKLSRVAPFVSRVQIDIVDGTFAPSLTWPFRSEDKESYTNLLRAQGGLPHSDTLEFEIDMMVTSPDQYIEDWKNIGARCLIIHALSTPDLSKTIGLVRQAGLEAAVALRPSDPLDILDSVMDTVSFVQVMGNDKIGYHGVGLDEKIFFSTVSRLRERYKEVTIGVDIGVTLETAPRLKEAGITRFATGSTLFNAPVLEEVLTKLQNI